MFLEDNVGVLLSHKSVLDGGLGLGFESRDGVRAKGY